MIALLLNHLWQSSLCVGGAGLLALALHRNGANVRFWLWFAASVKFLVPFALLTALGTYFLTPIVLPVAAPAVMLMEPLAKPFSVMAPALTVTAAKPFTAISPPASALTVPAPSVPARTAPVPTAAHLNLASVLVALWAAGFLTIVLRWLVRWSRVRALLRNAVALQVDAPVAVKFSPSRLEPGLVGILRPVILLPQGIEQQLSAVELKAVLAHELCHWRRHDNLLAAIHMLVEALFWFFPLVWWLGARLNAERERACDESVLADGNDPQMYAEGILKVCRVYLQSPLACVSGVSGARLKERIDAIMENRLIPQLNAMRKFMLSASAAVALVLPLMLGLAAVPVAQMQAKAAAIASRPSNAPISADDAATTRANLALNKPSRDNALSQGTTPPIEVVKISQPAPPSPDLSGLLPTENLATPTVVASNAATASDQHAALSLPTGIGLAANVTSEAERTLSKPSTGQASPVFGLPVESVTVLAIKPSGETIKGFVDARVVPTYTLHRMPRWLLPVCPMTVGLGDKYAHYISQRIRQVAAAVGAPVNSDPACRPNIEVVFTTTPQELMSNIRKTDPLYLGFHRTRGQADELAKVTHPIQAWYTTMTKDVYSRQPLGKPGGGAIDAGCPDPGMIVIKLGGAHELYLPCLQIAGQTPGGFVSRANDDLVAGLFNILIVAEPGKLYDYEVGSLADYIAMLALSQPSLDKCPELPSISNLLATECASATTARITDGDLAYLHALYKLPGGNFIATQQDYIREEMYRTLVTEKGG